MCFFLLYRYKKVSKNLLRYMGKEHGKSTIYSHYFNFGNDHQLRLS